MSDDELIKLIITELTREYDDPHKYTPQHVYTFCTDMTRAKANAICKQVRKKLPDVYIASSFCDPLYESISIPTVREPLNNTFKIGREFRFIPNQVNTRSQLIYFGDIKTPANASGALNFSRIPDNELHIDTYWD
jgi:hypothetical protein